MSLRLVPGRHFFRSARSALELPALSLSDLLTLLGWILADEGLEAEWPTPDVRPLREAYRLTTHLLASEGSPVRRDLLLALAHFYADPDTWYLPSLEGLAWEMYCCSDPLVSASGMALRLASLFPEDVRPVVLALRSASPEVLETFRVLALEAMEAGTSYQAEALPASRVWRLSSELLEVSS